MKNFILLNFLYPKNLNIKITLFFWLATAFLLLLPLETLKAQCPTIPTTPGTHTVNFTAGCTFNVPAGVTSMTIEAWGGGGAGGGVPSTSGAVRTGRGGGGGAYAVKTLAVTSNQTVAITVGAGGTGGTGNGPAGGDSYAQYASSTVVLAKGGTGGNVATANNNTGSVAGGSSSDCIGDDAKSGGNGGSGGYGGGGGGGGAGNNVVGNNGAGGISVCGNTITGGAGGSGNPNNGKGGDGGKCVSGNENYANAGGNAATYGGGGGGARKGSSSSSSAKGGNGAQGYVRITYTVSASSATITTSSVSGSPFCAGATVSVPFTISGTFNSGNIFTAQLSDASGSFASLVNIGTLSGTTAGTISATIPSGTASGTGYRIRVISSDPAIDGADNGANLTINALPSAPAATSQNFCGSATVANLAPSGTGISWYSSASGGTPLAGSTTLVTGTYYVSQTTGGCESSSTSVAVTVTAQPAAPTITSTPASCSAAGTSTISNYNAVYTYTFTPTGPTVGIGGSISNMITGTNYTVAASNGSCPSAASASFSNEDQFSAPAITIGTVTDATCGNSNGSINISVSGGTTPYTYLWSDGSASQNLTGVAAGTYTVTVTDDNGCTATNGAGTTVTNISGPSLTVGTVTDATCGNNNGSINISVSGGTTPYTYLWSDGSASQNLTGVAAGTYTVTVTDDNGCTATNGAGTTVTNISGPSLTVGTVTDATCGNSNGGIDISVSGGTTPYTYSWSNGSAAQNLTGVASGTYTVTVTDDNGCTATNGVGTTVTNISGPSLTVGTVTDATCGNSNGGVNISVSGGTAPYTYSWSNGSAAQNLTSVAAGTYTVTVTDDNGCTATNGAGTTVTNISGPSLTVGTVTDATCGNSNGGVNISVSGGTTPYIYSWSNGSAAQNLTGIAAGTYTVTVTDDNGCTATNGAGTTVTNISGPSLTVGTVTDATCGNSNGGINISVSGGTTPYTYSWSNGSAAQNLTGVAAGTYTVTVTDDNGCTATNGVGTTVTNISGPSLTVGTVTDVSCGTNNGSINISVSGGTAPYTYLWSDGSTAQNLTAVAAGTYTVTVTDDNGCTATNGTGTTVSAVSSGFQITSQPQDLSACPNSGASFGVSGTGITGYQWQVSTDNGSTWNDADDIAPVSGSTTATLNIASVTTIMNNTKYRCVLTTICGNINSAVATLSVPASGVVNITAQPQNTGMCTNGSTFVQVTAAGATAYQWEVSTDGGTTWANVTNNANYAGATTNQLTISGLGLSSSGALYRCQVTGPCGNTATNSATLTISDIALVTSQPTSEIVCESVIHTFSVQADLAVTYSWQISFDGNTWYDLNNSATYSGVNTPDLTISNVQMNLNSTKYRCSITGACGGFTYTNSAVLTVKKRPEVYFGIPQIACIYDSPYSINEVTPFGGTFSGTGISNNLFNPVAAGIGNHTITYTVTDNGCSSSASAIIEVSQCLGMTDLVKNELSIFPNPTSSVVYLKGNVENYETAVLIDNQGRMISSWDLKTTAQFDLSDFVDGYYFIRVVGKDNTIVTKIQLVK